MICSKTTTGWYPTIGKLAITPKLVQQELGVAEYRSIDLVLKCFDWLHLLGRSYEKGLDRAFVQITTADGIYTEKDTHEIKTLFEQTFGLTLISESGGGCKSYSSSGKSEGSYYDNAYTLQWERSKLEARLSELIHKYGRAPKYSTYPVVGGVKVDPAFIGRFTKKSTSIDEPEAFISDARSIFERLNMAIQNFQPFRIIRFESEQLKINTFIVKQVLKKGFKVNVEWAGSSSCSSYSIENNEIQLNRAKVEARLEELRPTQTGLTTSISEVLKKVLPK